MLQKRLPSYPAPTTLGTILTRAMITLTRHRSEPDSRSNPASEHLESLQLLILDIMLDRHNRETYCCQRISISGLMK